MWQADDRVTSDVADIFKQLGDASRLRIALCCMNSDVCVTDIAEQLRMSPSLVSHHLRLLRSARLVRSHRRGKQVYYSLADSHVRSVLNDMIDHVAERYEEALLPLGGVKR
ncbi:MAG TPA: metalloregulator ArsR/SmtB family transcription factor [Alphaproteobacteria bacterium]|nr:metalloregulator ArsR/SmtB family transcription factor [Alphaproteobacteria bacterium]